MERGTGEPLGGVSVWCYDYNEASKLINVQYSKADGKFEISVPKEGKYKLFFRTYGYFSDSVTVEIGTLGLDAGTIYLSKGTDLSDIQSLEEITITDRRPLIERHSDRIIYDVTRDPDAKKMRMTGILEKIPTMNFSSGKLEYAGLAIGGILINGEENEFINTSTQFPMNHIRGDVMAHIEVIPPGSPQYNNKTTIINIITSRSLPNGFATEIIGGYKTDNTWNSAIDFVSKLRDKYVYKIAYSGSGQESPKLNSETLYESIGGTAPTLLRHSYTETWSTKERHNLIFRSSLALGEKKLDFGFNTSFGQSKSYNLSKHIINGSEQSLELSDYLGMSKTIPTLSCDLKFTFEKSKKRYAYITYNYANNIIELSNQTDQTGENEEIFTISSSEGKNYSKVHTAQSYNQFNFNSGHSITIRGLYIHRTYDDLTQTLLRTPDDTRTEIMSGLIYNQQVMGLNGIYNYRARKFSTAASLGTEYEANQGTFRNTNTPLNHNHWQLNPRVSLSWRIRKFSLGSHYSMTNIRPTMAMLNPYEESSDPKNILRGNPDLLSETKHSITLSLSRNFGTLSGKVELALHYDLIPNAIERVTEPMDNGINITTYHNVGKRERYRIGFDNGVIPINQNIYIQYFAGYSFIFYTSHNPNIGSNLTKSFDCIAVLSARLWKGTNIRGTYNLYSTLNLPQSKKTGYLHQFNLRIDQTIIKNKLAASVAILNPFSSRPLLQQEITGSDFRMVSQYEHLGRIFGISLRVNFGRLKDRVPEAEKVPDDTSR